MLGVDPGEEAWFELDGAAYDVQPEDLISNPDVTPEALFILAGRLRSASADGSAATRILPMDIMQLGICASGGDGVIVRPTIDAYCQCGNGNKHFGEDCDDGGVTDGDGCSSECLVEAGWSCLGSPSVCVVPEPGQTALLAVAALALVARAARRRVPAPARAAGREQVSTPGGG